MPLQNNAKIQSALPLSVYLVSSNTIPPPVFDGTAFDDEDEEGGEAEDDGRVSNNCLKVSEAALEMLDEDVTNWGRQFPTPFT